MNDCSLYNMLVSSNFKKPKTIFHIDGDAFFVGVEIAKNPKLKGLPVVTGEERGIVSALSYEAKDLGIVRGMPIYKVKKDFPKVLVLAGDYKSYAKYSAMMFDIVRRYTDDVEEYSIDECFADLTGLESSLKMSCKQIAVCIKNEINKELGLSVSIGLAPTKVLSKVASKFVKPNGLTVINTNDALEFLDKTPIEKIWGIGRQTSIFLKRKGINTAKEFVEKDIEWIKTNLSKPYEVIWQELRGVRILEIDPKTKTTFSSIQRTRSFHPNTNDVSFLLSELSKNIEDACAKARRYKLAPKKISFFLKTKDFLYVTSTFSLTNPSNTPEIITSLVQKKFEEIYKKGVLYRTTGITLENLTPNHSLQKDLFGDSNQADKFEVIHKQIDILESKFGKHMVYLASTQEAIKHRKLGTDSDDLDRNLLFL